jgi:hypothetical protein
MSRAQIEQLNYYNDHRVQAAGSKPWHVTHNGTTHVAINVPTDDYQWLVDNDYDPDEFVTPVRPTSTSSYVDSEDDCDRCNGTHKILRHKMMKGVTFPSAGDLYKTTWGRTSPHYATELENHPENFDTLDCYSCETGKRRVLEHHEERLDADAEDRNYVAFKPVLFPMKLVPCGTCNGTGKHVNPSIDCGGISQDDFDADPGFREAYFGGAYDVTCYGCSGAKQLPIVDEDALDAEDKAKYERWRAYADEVARDEADYAAERAAERRMGC